MFGLKKDPSSLSANGHWQHTVMCRVHTMAGALTRKADLGAHPFIVPASSILAKWNTTLR